MEAPSTPNRFYLITYPRTASNLLVRILALDKQPNFVPPEFHAGYFFMPALRKGRELNFFEKLPKDWGEGERQQMMQAYRDCFDKFQQYLDQTAAQGKNAFVKEHTLMMLEPTTQVKATLSNDSTTEPPWTVNAAGQPASEWTRSRLNQTLFSDEFLKTFLPIFLVRHPALAFPSMYRARRDIEGEAFGAADNPIFNFIMTLRWSRSLYDFYAQHFSSSESYSHLSSVWPMVLDADDIIGNRDVLKRFCELTGLDLDKLQFDWETTKTTEMGGMDPKEARMMSTLSNSVGIDKKKLAGDIDIDAEARKWKEEFGEAVAAVIEKHVRESMPDYEFLRSKRLTPNAQPEQTHEAPRKDTNSSKESAGFADSSTSSTSAEPRARKPSKPRFGLLRKLLPCIPSTK